MITASQDEIIQRVMRCMFTVSHHHRYEDEVIRCVAQPPRGTIKLPADVEKQIKETLKHLVEIGDLDLKIAPLGSCYYPSIRAHDKYGKWMQT